MPEPTKADLKAAVAKLTEEVAALYDIFAAAREASDAGADVHYLFGYVSGIGSQPWEHGNVPVLRDFAGALRLKGREADAPRGLASCGHPANDDGECDCSSWPERAVMAR
jgi:hypothetical protein